MNAPRYNEGLPLVVAILMRLGDNKPKPDDDDKHDLVNQTRKFLEKAYAEVSQYSVPSTYFKLHRPTYMCMRLMGVANDPKHFKFGLIRC